MAEHTEVVVIGGGYAGVLAASRLTRRDDVAVTLINPRPTFVERIRLHQLVAVSDDAVMDYGRVLGKDVRLVVDTVTRIDAVGSTGADPHVPGAAEFAHPIASIEDAQQLRRVIESAPVTASVTVVGAGPTGIETAAELAEAGRVVTLICGVALGPYLHPRGRHCVARRLAKLGVTVIEGPETKVTAVTREVVQLGDGTPNPAVQMVTVLGTRRP